MSMPYKIGAWLRNGPVVPKETYRKPEESHFGGVRSMMWTAAPQRICGTAPVTCNARLAAAVRGAPCE